MDLLTAFTEIEDVHFSVTLTVASRLSMLLDTAEQRQPVQTVWKATETKEGREALRERINYLCELPFDEQYAYPFDTALTIYLHLLYSRDPQEGKLAAQRVSQVPQLGWADDISYAILSQEAPLRQASS